MRRMRRFLRRYRKYTKMTAWWCWRHPVRAAQAITDISTHNRGLRQNDNERQRQIEGLKVDLKAMSRNAGD